MTWLEQLPGLQGQTVKVFASTPVDGSVQVVFSEGATLRAGYWRICETITQRGQARISSFDHAEIYGLLKAIDAVEILRGRVEGRPIVASKYDSETGDLLFEFAGGSKLQILNITGNEVWEIGFTDGTVEYSNYV